MHIELLQLETHNPHALSHRAVWRWFWFWINLSLMTFNFYASPTPQSPPLVPSPSHLLSPLLWRIHVVSYRISSRFGCVIPDLPICPTQNCTSNQCLAFTRCTSQSILFIFLVTTTEQQQWHTTIVSWMSLQIGYTHRHRHTTPATDEYL